MKLLFLCLAISVASLGQDYAVSKIPANLLQGATAVVRQDKIEFEVEDKGSAVESTLFAVTVFSEAAAEKHNTLQIPYSKLSKIRHIEGKIYAANGEVLQKVRNSDIRDVGLGAYGNEISDNRLKIISFDMKNLSLPYTIEYSYTEETENLIFYPAWEAGVDDETAVMQSSLVIRVPSDVSFRYLEKGFNNDVKKTASVNGKVVKWEVKNLPVRKSETLTKDYQMLVVFTAPIEFEVQGIEGSFNT
ncbi:MAG: DUF3857 domain-containing protein, partial [Spirosomataceae bacterium]